MSNPQAFNWPSRLGYAELQGAVGVEWWQLLEHIHRPDVFCMDLEWNKTIPTTINEAVQGREYSFLGEAYDLALKDEYLHVYS